MAADYLKEVAQLTGITFKVTHIADNNFKAVSDALHRGDVDLLPTQMIDQNKPPSLLVTDPYIRIPVVVVMQAEAPRLKDPSLLESMQVAGVRSIQPKLESLGLNLRMEHTSPREGLMGVATGKYQAFLGELATISHQLASFPVTNIKISGELPVPSEFGMAVPSRLSAFIPIANKAIQAIPQERKDAIWQKWFRVTYEQEYASRAWLQLIGLSSFITLLIAAAGFFYYRRRLSGIKQGLAALEPHLLCVHIDRNITITEVTEALCKATGFQPHDLVGKPLRMLSAPSGTAANSLESLFDSVSKRNSWQGEVKLVKKDGSELWTDVVISPSRRKNENSDGYTIIYQDASRRKHFETLAIRDELTGLYNRRHFNSLAPELLRRAAGDNQWFSLFLLDVDNFKKYNDNYGHPAGDKVLAAIGRTLKQSVQRENDASFRLGGEEFAVIALLPARDDATLIGQKLLGSIQKLNIEHQYNPPGVITVSIGICVAGAKNFTGTEGVYTEADRALYKAKASGRNCFVLSDQ